jgi:CLASP N terminal
MASERTRLSGPAVELVSVIGARMGIKFEPLIPLYVPTILKLCTRSSKIYVSRAQACLKLFASHCRVPVLVSLFKEAVTDKSQTLRISATDALHDFLSTSLRDGLPRMGKWVEDIEWIIKATARDATPETRKLSRRVFATYAQLWPERVNE